MFPHNTAIIGASRSRELGADYFSFKAAALSFAVAKPLLSVSKSVSIGIPTAIWYFCAYDLKVRCTFAGEEWVGIPSLPNVINVSAFIFTA